MFLKLRLPFAVADRMDRYVRWFVVVIVGCCACTSVPKNGAALKELGSEGRFQGFSCSGSEADEKELQIAARERAKELGVVVEYDYLRIGRVHDGSRARQAELGKVCSGAADVDACRARVLSLEGAVEDAPGPHRYQYSGRIYAILTNGDEVQVRTTGADLRALFGPIDNPYKAWIMAQVEEGIGPHGCAHDGTTGYRLTADGIELRHIETLQPCPLETMESSYLVHLDGSVTLKSRRTESHADICVVA